MIITTHVSSAPLAIRKLHGRLFPLPTCFGYVAGGCIRDTLAGDPVKDVDIFFTSEKEYRGALRAVLPALCRFVNANAVGITLPKLGDVDVCRASFRTPGEMLERFDFVCCAVALTHDGKYIRHEAFERDVAERKLTVNDPANATHERAMRLVTRGWGDIEQATALPRRFPVAYP